MSTLEKRKCKPCEGNVAPYNAAQIKEMLAQLKGWIVEDGKLVKLYPFKNYYETMAFVNGLALISHREDHHPELVVNYNKCEVRYDTHSVGGLTENDFICAAKADAMLKL